MSALAEAVSRARALPLILMYRPHLRGIVTDCINYARRVEEAEARVRIVCAVVGAAPEPFLPKAAGNPEVLEAIYRRIASDGSAALSALASELADA
jgi:hypothetical protein